MYEAVSAVPNAAGGGIQILPPEEARRIAAGEVIDRPAALIRELLDNAIDSGAGGIEVSIEEGGSKKVEVADDGSGMNHDDLQICWLAHATSKIRSLDDLNTAGTLGFRGEALAAAAAVARLEIVSSITNGEAWRFTVGPGESHPPSMERASRTRGSTVRALNLYDTIPARKRFLKREGSEAALCRQVFIEKALAFPEITFRFTQDGRPKIFLPAAASKKERFAAALLDTPESNFLHEIHVSGGGFSAEVVIGGPELFRSDRRMLYVFANGRRIQDYSLITALEYGTQGWFPNGVHPLGAVYVTIDPALADFNIHPAKREVRFQDPGAIHHAITTGLRDFCHRLNLKTGTRTETGQGMPLALEALRDRPSAAEAQTSAYASQRGGNAPHRAPDAAPLRTIGDIASIVAAVHTAEEAPIYGEPRYAGRIFGVFLLAEWGDKLFIIDQHAAHERILYNRFLSFPIHQQELLIPIFFNTETAEDADFLAAKKDELARLGIVIERDADGWRIDALPEGWQSSDTDTVREILALRTARENIAERWAATLCCHQAVRDGDFLDDATAFALVKEALALPDPHCPHGRPVWTEISREALYRAVRRT
ncbi:MAG: DNA mismatch repair endonuclease MutL [Treponema sp.]|jgi:DNA mismatch repair protein MutL|nr:DNA mismatch repair endonuclease MutL [Treponema sp.]